MKREFASEEVALTAPVNPAATGEGFALALEHGAQIVNGDIVRGPLLRLVPPNDDTMLRRLPPSRMLARAMRWGAAHLPAALLRRFTVAFFVTAVGPSPELFKTGAILVNNRGERFTDERRDPARAVAAQPDNMAYILLDNDIGQRFEAWPNYISTAPGVAYAYLDDYRRHRPDIFHRAPTLAALAALLGIPPAALAATVATRNASLTEGLAPISTGPFTALGPVRSYVVFTDGGLRITERCEVCGTDGRPIAGLFAAGSAGQGGILLPGHGHHLGWAFVSGRIAGRNAASNPPVTEAPV
jgi:succinate dehydrogenase/fumarate reductase flavoprotein subunit